MHLHISIYIFSFFLNKLAFYTFLLTVAQSSAWILTLHICASRVKMQKHSLGPQFPVRREGEAQPECEGGTQ